MRQVTIVITEDDQGKVSVRQDGPEDKRQRFNPAEIIGLVMQYLISISKGQ